MMGQKFNRLTVVKFSHVKRKHKHWFCRCECGKLVVIEGYSIRSGHAKSCGCLRLGHKSVITEECRRRAKMGLKKWHEENTGTVRARALCAPRDSKGWFIKRCL